MFIIFAGSGIQTYPSNLSTLFSSLDENTYADTRDNFTAARQCAQRLMLLSMGNAMANRGTISRGFGYVFELDESFNLIERFETTAQIKILTDKTLENEK